MAWTEDIINAGGQMIVTKRSDNTSDSTIVLTLSVELDNQYYHKALLFDSIRKMNDVGDEVAEAFSMGLGKLRRELNLKAIHYE